MKTIVTSARSFTGRPTPGKKYEWRMGYLLRAVPAKGKFHASIVLPNVWNETTYGGWDSEGDALDWMRTQVDDVFHTVPPLIREANRQKFAAFIMEPIAPTAAAGGTREERT